jgi:RNA polymerase sigma-70 factor, ECF subfamily
MAQKHNIEMEDSTPATIEKEVVKLYEETATGLLRYAMMFTEEKESAQDALQEAFLRFFVRRAEGVVIQNRKAWLYRVLRNLLLDRIKEARVRTHLNLEDVVEPADPKQNPEVTLQKAEHARMVLDKMSPRELECLRLRTEGFDYDEIAGLMDIRKGTVGALLARALGKIRET